MSLLDFDFDLSGVTAEVAGIGDKVRGALQGTGVASLIRLPRTFPDSPLSAIGTVATRYGFGGAAKALSTGRIDDIAAAVGQDALGVVVREGVRRLNVAIDGIAGGLFEFLQSSRADPPPVGEVLLILGDFAFMVGAIAHQHLKRTHEYRWAKQDRLLHVPARQFVGVGDERIELDGYLLPHYTGGADALDHLRTRAALGQPQELIDHFGAIYGRYVVESIEESGSELDIYGQPRKIDFKLALAAYGEDDADPLGDLIAQIGGDGATPDATEPTAAPATEARAP